MGIFTISPDLLRNIEKDEGVYLTDILFVFTQRSNHFKVTKDKKGHVINCYSNIKQNLDIIKIWLDLMSFKPSPFEIVDIELDAIECEETKFLSLCKACKDSKKMVVYSKQNLKKYPIVDDWIEFEGAAIKILDRDQARIVLGTHSDSAVSNVYIGSQIAQNNSSITKSSNNEKK